MSIERICETCSMNNNQFHCPKFEGMDCEILLKAALKAAEERVKGWKESALELGLKPDGNNVWRNERAEKAEKEMNHLDMILSDYGVKEYISALESRLQAEQERAEKAEGQRDATIHELDLMNKNYTALESRLRGVQEALLSVISILEADREYPDEQLTAQELRLGLIKISDAIPKELRNAIKAASTPKKGER